MKEKKEKVQNKKKIDKMGLATKIIAAIMAILMLGGMMASFAYYLIRMFK